MLRRRPVSRTFEENIAAEKAKLEAQLADLMPGPEMDALRKKLRQLDTAAHMSEWLKSRPRPADRRRGLRRGPARRDASGDFEIPEIRSGGGRASGWAAPGPKAADQSGSATVGFEEWRSGRARGGLRRMVRGRRPSRRASLSFGGFGDRLRPGRRIAILVAEGLICRSEEARPRAMRSGSAAKGGLLRSARWKW
jgi:hypothetical protein